MFTAPDEHMPYIIQLHIMSIQPANKAAEHLMRERERDYKKGFLGEIKLISFHRGALSPFFLCNKNVYQD